MWIHIYLLFGIFSYIEFYESGSLWSHYNWNIETTGSGHVTVTILCDTIQIHAIFKNIQYLIEEATNKKITMWMWIHTYCIYWKKMEFQWSLVFFNWMIEWASYTNHIFGGIPFVYVINSIWNISFFSKNILYILCFQKFPFESVLKF